MAITEFPTKAAVVVRGLIGGSEERLVGEEYVEADGRRYLPLLVQPLVVLAASGPKLQTDFDRQG